MEKEYGAEKTGAIIEDAWRRYAEIVDENDDEPKKMYMHTRKRIYPAIAAFDAMTGNGISREEAACALPGFVDSKNEEKTERNAGYLVVSHSGGGMLRQGTRKGIRRTPANRGMRAHWVVKGLDISEDVCHGLCP